MPIDAMKGFSLASSALRPSTVVSTFIAFRASPLGFSANSVTRRLPSIFMRPKSLARVSSYAMQPMVMSAPLVRW